MSGHRRARERGSATVLLAGLVVLLVTATLALAVLGGVVAGQRRAESAADLAALAGAGALQDGGDGCAKARAVAAANGAALLACSVAAGRVEVVAGEETLVLGRRVSLRARARAGPTGADAGG